MHVCQSLFLNKIADWNLPNFIKKETLAHVFSCGFSGIFKKTFFTEHLLTTVFEKNICLKWVKFRFFVDSACFSVFMFASNYLLPDGLALVILFPIPGVLVWNYRTQYQQNLEIIIFVVKSFISNEYGTWCKKSYRIIFFVFLPLKNITENIVTNLGNFKM